MFSSIFKSNKMPRYNNLSILRAVDLNNTAEISRMILIIEELLNLLKAGKPLPTKWALRGNPGMVVNRIITAIKNNPEYPFLRSLMEWFVSRDNKMTVDERVRVIEDIIEEDPFINPASHQKEYAEAEAKFLKFLQKEGGGEYSLGGRESGMSQDEEMAFATDDNGLQSAKSSSSPLSNIGDMSQSGLLKEEQKVTDNDNASKSPFNSERPERTATQTDDDEAPNMIHGNAPGETSNEKSSSNTAVGRQARKKKSKKQRKKNK